MLKESFSENKYAEYWIENGVVNILFKPDLKVIDLEVAKAIVKTRLHISNGISRPLFVDLSTAIIIDKQSRKYWAEEEAMKYITAMAVLTKSTLHKIGASFYIHFDKPPAPTKIFTYKSDALIWLEKFKLDKGNTNSAFKSKL